MKKIKTKKNNKFVSGFLLGIISMIIVLGCIFGGLYVAQKDMIKESVSEKTQLKMNSLKALIDYYYLGDINEKDLEENVYKGLIDGLNDPYSKYYTKEEYKQFLEDSSGIYSGIGTLVSSDVNTKFVTIINVFKNSPAEKAGICVGDVIYKIDDVEVVGKDINQVVSKIKGEKGSKVKVTVYRPETDKYIDCLVTRDNVSVPTVSYKIIDSKNKIGYVQITEFDEVTYKQFQSAMKDLNKKGIKAVIFDVRNNPGGLYSSVCKVLDDILPEGTIVYTEDKQGKKNIETSDAKCLKMPMIVLQNEHSASAAEIFSGAIKDFGVGTIIGKKSFGKGIVQSTIPLSDGSAVKLTIQKYFTPKGENIHEKGITPDVEIEDNKNTKEDEVIVEAVKRLTKNKDNNKKTVKSKTKKK